MERTRATALRNMRNIDIENLLAESDVEDFAPSDEDTGDPSFVITSENIASSSEDETYEVRTTRNEGNCYVRRGSRRLRARTRGRIPPSSVGTSASWTIGNFQPKEFTLLEPSYLIHDTDGFDIIDYFHEYIDDELVRLIVEKSNQTAVKLHGRSLNLDLKECYLYIGITLVMASVNYPNLRMYWEKKWRVETIASQMSRNRFVQLRNALKLVFDDEITQEIRAGDKLWKVRPLILRMQKGCRSQEKPRKLCVDEMIVPFTGTCGIKQFCPNKPNPEGLKIFVLASPDGVVCDFHVYQGATTYAEFAEETRFGLGEKAVLTLAEGLVPGHVLYFDRYFTSEKLIDELLSRGIGSSGTVMKNRIPRDARPAVEDDRDMKNRGRGSTQVLIREDNKMALTKWFDNKAVTLLSSIEGDEEMDLCRRWCKTQKKYVDVDRPRVIRNYNINMGGVDLADRLLAVCPYRYRTRKWTQRFMSQMIDLAVSNSWLKYKKDQLKRNVPIKNILQSRGFKIELGERLIETHTRPLEVEDSSDTEPNAQPVKRKRGKPTTPLPSKTRRLQGASHMPMFNAKQSRCRHCHYKKSRVTCTTCLVTLCLNSDRNCYSEFHKQ